MDEWTEEQWGNLDRQAARIQQLLETRKRDITNLAWRTKLRLTLFAIDGFTQTLVKK